MNKNRLLIFFVKPTLIFHVFREVTTLTAKKI